MSFKTFNNKNFKRLCNELAKRDDDLRKIISENNYPPLFSREANFETLIYIILEQQVSLASAKAALLKLKEKIGVVTPEKIIALTNEALKACYFSRQKIVYAKELANAIIQQKINLASLQKLDDATIRNELIKIKGIGNWTIDVFLMMALNRTDCFPTGDIALMNSIKHAKQLPKHTSKEEIVLIAEKWKPYRTIAAYILWWDYIKRKNIRY